MENHLQELQRIENKVAAAIRANHARELAVVDDALNQIISGLNDFGSLKGKPDNPLESARLFLATRSFNSLRIAKQTLEYGYYQQAMTLVRMVMEDQLIANDAENHTPTLDALLYDNGKIGSGDLSLTKMAERISPKAKEAWDANYGHASKYAAHPRQLSLHSLTSIGPDDQITLQPGSHHDELEVKNVLYHLASQIVQVWATTAKLTHEVGSGWADSALPVFKEIMSLCQQIDEWAGEQLEEPEVGGNDR